MRMMTKSRLLLSALLVLLPPRGSRSSHSNDGSAVAGLLLVQGFQAVTTTTTPLDRQRRRRQVSSSPLRISSSADILGQQPPPLPEPQHDQVEKYEESQQDLLLFATTTTPTTLLSSSSLTAASSSPSVNTLGTSYRVTSTLVLLASLWYLWTWTTTTAASTDAIIMGGMHSPSLQLQHDGDFAAGVMIPLHILWNTYQTCLQDHPIPTKAATSATVYAIGDMIAQQSSAMSSSSSSSSSLQEDHTNPTTITTLDLSRVAKSFLVGGLGHGPLSHVWYNWSEAAVSQIQSATSVLVLPSWSTVGLKIVMDQTIWGPIWTTLYLTMMGLLNLQGLQQIRESIQTKLLPLTLNGLYLWPLAHVITYGCLPVQDRLAWVDLVEIVWVTILAQQANAAAAPTVMDQTSFHDNDDDDDDNKSGKAVIDATSVAVAR